MLHFRLVASTSLTDNTSAEEMILAASDFSPVVNVQLPVDDHEGKAGDMLSVACIFYRQPSFSFVEEEESGAAGAAGPRLAAVHEVAARAVMAARIEMPLAALGEVDPFDEQKVGDRKKLFRIGN